MTETTLMGLTKDLYNPSFKEHILSEFQYMIYQLETDATKMGAKINWGSFTVSVQSEGYEAGTMLKPEIEYLQHWRVNVEATKPDV